MFLIRVKKTHRNCVEIGGGARRSQKKQFDNENCIFETKRVQNLYLKGVIHLQYQTLFTMRLYSYNGYQI